MTRWANYLWCSTGGPSASRLWSPRTGDRRLHLDLCRCRAGSRCTTAAGSETARLGAPECHRSRPRSHRRRATSTSCAASVPTSCMHMLPGRSAQARVMQPLAILEDYSFGKLLAAFQRQSMTQSSNHSRCTYTVGCSTTSVRHFDSIPARQDLFTLFCSIRLGSSIRALRWN